MSRLALVTGASSGIGRATSELLVAQGWRVIALARRAEVLHALAEALGDALIPVACDGGDGDAVLRVAQQIVGKHGVPEVIIHSAGAGQWKEIEHTSPQDLDQMMAAPFRSAFHINHAFVGEMIERGHGRLIHINSPASVMPWAGATGYVAARFALRGLHEALVTDLQGSGVSSTNIIFGEVSSAYFEANPGSHHKVPQIAALVPTMTPEACAKVVVRAVASSKRELLAPFMLRVFFWTFRLSPALVRLVIAWTQRKR